MVSLQINCEIIPGQRDDFVRIIRDKFIPAISKQPGFVRVSLLKKREEDLEFQISIVFETEELRQEWVKSPDHQKVWPKVRSHFRDVSNHFYEVV